MRIFAFTVLLIAAPLAPARAEGFGWRLVNWKVRRDFPTIRRITPKETAAWLADDKRPPPVLLDVRTKAEYEISHIHGAQRVEPGADANAIKLPRDCPIVTYCSVGYRSGAFAKKLQDAGYINVQNMSGSIFQWANEGRPVERDGRRAEKVHPYDGLWGKLLNAPLRADVPTDGKEK